MVQILRHELKKQGNETVLFLYLDQSNTEFARELGSLDDNTKGDLDKSVNSYIRSKLPNLKQATVKIMVGGLLVTSFAFSPAVGGLFGGDDNRAHAAEVDVEYKGFPDVSSDRESAPAIEALVKAGVIKGYPDGFHPREEISRQHAAVMFVRALKLPTDNVTDPGFKDVPTTHPYYKEIAAATAAGFFNKGDNFNPTNNFTRGQSASVIVRAYDLKGDTTTPFTDLAGSGHEEAIGIMYNLGLAKGTGDTFKPGNNVTREQFAMLLHRTIEAQGDVITPDPDPDPVPVVEVASATASANAFFATANKNTTAFDVVSFLDAKGAPIDVSDFSQFKVYDNKGLFKEDGSLADAYKTNGLTNTGNVTIVINDADGSKLGEFTVNVVNGNSYSTILDGVIKKDGAAVSYATLGSSYSFDITKAIKYNNDVIGDEEKETVGLAAFAGADLSSSDPTVFVVNDAGTITTIKEGRADLLVKWNDKTFTYPVEVKATPVVNSIDINGGTTFDLTTADNERTFTYQVKDQHGANFNNAISIVPTDPAATVAGIDVTDNDNGTITVKANTSIVNKDTQATYNVKSGDKTIGTVTVNYQQAGAATSYVLRTTAADNVIDFYATGDATKNIAPDNAVSYEFVGLDSKGLVAEVSSSSDGTAKTITANGKTYTVSLAGVDATNPEATLGFADGKVTVTSTAKAPAAGKDVTVTVKEGNITRATQAVTVKNSTPAPAELVSYGLVEGETAVKANGTHTFADLVALGYFTAVDQYGKPYNLTAENVTMYTTDEKVFTVDPTTGITVVGENGAKANLVVTLGGTTKVFELVVDKSAPVAVVDATSTATSLKLNFNENLKTFAVTTEGVTGPVAEDVTGKKTTTLSVPATTTSVAFTATDKLGNEKAYTATFANGAWTVAETPATPPPPPTPAT
jgi:hypothetical protein